MKVGVLGLQGAISPHVRMLEKLGVEASIVTTSEKLQAVDRLIIPGGESTTMLKLIDRTELFEPLRAFGKERPIWGTCAGAILIAEEVQQPSQRSLSLMNISATRNAYGSQRESFKTKLDVQGLEDPIEVDFIRAPKLFSLSSAVTVLAKEKNDAVLLQQGHLLASSFHVELGEDTRLHQLFLDLPNAKAFDSPRFVKTEGTLGRSL